MNKFINIITKLAHNFIIIISKIIERTKLLLLKCYKEFQFLTNKQTTIKTMYEPLIKKKEKENIILSKKLEKIKNDNKTLLVNIKKLEKENSTLKQNSTTLQELVARRVF